MSFQLSKVSNNYKLGSVNTAGRGSWLAYLNYKVISDFGLLQSHTKIIDLDLN